MGPSGAGWTGGQYSVVRALFAAGVTLPLLPRIAAPSSGSGGRVLYFPNVLELQGGAAVPALLLAATVLCGLLVAAGWLERVAAPLLVYLWICLLDAGRVAPGVDSVLVLLLLLALLLVPPGPYGSWAGRGRPDPGGGWRMPPALPHGLWALMALGYAYEGLLGLLDGPSPRAAGLLVAPLSLVRRARPWLWTALLVLQTWSALGDGAAGGWLLILLFTFEPAWIRPTGNGGRDLLYYDGTCGLCHRWVRFLLAEDGTGRAFRFAPLQGEAFRRTVGEGRRDELPDSIVLRRPDGSLLVRSAAVRRILRRLGGIWALLGVMAGVFPAALRDAVYDGVAAARYRVFRRPASWCPTLPDRLRERFDA